MTLDPKKRFRISPNGKIWSEAVATDWFKEGLEAAIVTMGQNTPNAADSGTAIAHACRAEGARQLIAVMLTLTDTKPDAPVPAMPANLRPTK
jgi:hypothetical protein